MPPFRRHLPPKLVVNPWLGGPHLNGVMAPQNLNRIAEYFQCLTEGTKMLVWGQLWTTGVNLPSINVDAAHGGLPGGVPSIRLSRNSCLRVSNNWSHNNGNISQSSAACAFFGSRHAFFCPFCLFILFLRGQNPLLYRGIQYFGFPQSCNVAPQDCFFQIQWMDSDAGFYGDYDISIKHDPRPRFNRDMSVQSQITGS